MALSSGYSESGSAVQSSASKGSCAKTSPIARRTVAIRRRSQAALAGSLGSIRMTARKWFVTGTDTGVGKTFCGGRAGARCASTGLARLRLQANRDRLYRRGLRPDRAVRGGGGWQRGELQWPPTRFPRRRRRGSRRATRSSISSESSRSPRVSPPMWWWWRARARAGASRSRVRRTWRAWLLDLATKSSWLPARRLERLTTAY